MENLLRQCRTEIGGGNGMEALSLVLSALRINHSEEEIMQIMSVAKEKGEFERQHSEAPIDIATRLCQLLVEQDTLLAEQGMEDILVDAFQDGSSAICQRCGGLVPRDRMDAHSKYWCSEGGEGAGGLGSDEDDDI
jgi:hypothetical protein